MAADQERIDDAHAAEAGIVCVCGYENFERVVVERRASGTIVTDFLACVGCRAMYFVPLPRPRPVVRPPGHGVGTMVIPRQESAEALKRDAAEAATHYRKPGRSGRLKPGGRG